MPALSPGSVQAIPLTRPCGCEGEHHENPGGNAYDRRRDHAGCLQPGRTAQRGLFSWPSRRSATGSGETPGRIGRSDEHTSELQSLMRISSAVFCLKKNITKYYLSQIYKM